ncbi:ORF84 [Agrotis segetum granulovirus]|uniref:ORF84 n=1 Tax=Agrotis segetum granulosis virus TaxID=10464 RepID=Q6QXM4_GVAS|nr:hypothetical protein AsGV098 [Agrotis segetum granulovirus]AAS82654.1 ORF84 [Agrotis segetum granulovirus]AHN92135.1 hypothetical protein AsGV096 [Agrotis segetum granulovirus]AKN63372.1 hypothetical protein AsGV098 [Agrotis segetum granulovirus]
MPYNNVSDLPSRVKNSLPYQAQRMYLRVYNSAMDRYENPSRVAWGVVKKHYTKLKDGRWVQRDEALTDTSDTTTTDDDEFY